jgi:hypothetical protein
MADLAQPFQIAGLAVGMIEIIAKPGESPPEPRQANRRNALIEALHVSTRWHFSWVGALQVESQ